ncbi:MAG: pyridoxal phosphate-dependent aminotransferase, partial [Thermodesulfobacteriota bacterium]
DVFSYIRNPEGRAPVVALRTFSKAFGLAGLRVGFGLMHPEIAGLLHRVRQPFNINLLAQIGATAALEDLAHYEMTIRETSRGRAWLSAEVEKLGCRAYPSHTNFFLIDVRGDATRLYDAMLHQGVIVRSMKPYGYPDFIRITVGTEAENQRFVLALATCLRELNYV